DQRRAAPQAMLTQKVVCSLSLISRYLQFEIRLTLFYRRRPMQEPLEFRDQVSVEKHFATLIFPGGRGNRVRQKFAAVLGVIADSQPYPGQEGDRRGFEGILKQDGEIKPALPPFANLVPNRAQAGTIVDENLIDEIRVNKNVRGVWTRHQRDARMGKHPAQIAQRRHSHHRVANPVCAADNDAFYLIWL